MARIAQFRKILKDDLFKRIKFFIEFLSAKDIIDAAATENYRRRNRIWTPIQTLWAFLVQVLEPDCSCREAVARILAKQAQIRNAGGSLRMRTVYLHAIRGCPEFNESFIPPIPPGLPQRFYQALCPNRFVYTNGPSPSHLLLVWCW